MTLLLRDQLSKAMKREVLDERLIVVPLLDDDQVGAGTIDLRLGTEFIEIRRWTETGIDPLNLDPQSQSRLVQSAQTADRAFVSLGAKFVLHPGQFVLGATLEFIRLPLDISGQVVGRSSWGRLGLMVATAVVVQPGFAGVLTLELVNAGSVPIHLYPGLRVAQLQLWMAESATGLPETDRPKYAVPLGPESVHLAWKSDEVDRIKAIGNRLAGGPN